MVETELKQKESIRVGLQLSLTRAIVEAKAILTPAQRMTFQSMLKKENKMIKKPHGHFDEGCN
jgi:Spy/CpxP family protein refolding chaperone